MENYVIFEIIQYNILVVPSSDDSTKCSNLHAEQTGCFVFTTLTNSVKDCIIDLKKSPNPMVFICIPWMCSSVYRNNYYSFVLYETDISKLIKTFINDL